MLRETPHRQTKLLDTSTVTSPELLSLLGARAGDVIVSDHWGRSCGWLSVEIIDQVFIRVSADCG